MIRKATLEDVPQLVSLAIQMWKSHTVEDLTKIFCEHIRKGKNFIFLAISEEHIVGFAQCGLRFDYVEGTDSSPVGYLEGIFVLEEYKKRGYAKELLGECQNWAKDQGCLEFASDCDSVKADIFGFDIADVSGSIRLFLDVMKKLGIKLDGDGLYEEFQRIYDEAVNRDVDKYDKDCFCRR